MQELKETDLDPDPFAQFGRWFEDAKKNEPGMPEAYIFLSSRRWSASTATTDSR